MSDDLAAEIAALARELEQLPLAKAARDRRLQLNAQLEQLRTELAAVTRGAQLRGELEAVQAKLAELPPDAKAERRALSKERSRLEAALADLSRPAV